MTERQKKQYSDIKEKSNKRVIGKKFGRLTVLEYAYTGNNYHKYFTCICDCGKITTVDMKHLLYGKIKSCGCLWEDNKHEYKKIHGDSKKDLYYRWLSMKRRCNKKDDERYKDYGGRGITICKEWMEYGNFKEWALKNGYEKNLEIDRINNNKGYSPSNCHFVTALENNRNKRNNVYITYNGKTMTISQWSLETGISNSTISARIKKLGWDGIRAITQSVK